MALHHKLESDFHSRISLVAGRNFRQQKLEKQLEPQISAPKESNYRIW